MYEDTYIKCTIANILKNTPVDIKFWEHLFPY